MSFPPQIDPSFNPPPCPFPQPSRHITTHNTARKAIFSDAASPAVEPQYMPQMIFYNCYTTETCAHPPPANSSPATTTSNGSSSSSNPLVPLPTSVATNTDLTTYMGQNYPAMSRLDTPHGSVLRILDFAPGAIAPMHRTQSLDYAIVLEGTLEAILDSGETRRMERGSVLIQRGTMHAWREGTGEQWARIAFVLLGFGGKGLEVGMVGTEGLASAPGEAAGEGEEVPEWRTKFEARNDGKELKEWLPWNEGVPVPSMAEEVMKAREMGEQGGEH